ncbi:hypothetical protein N7532_005204 [Penicillium argentinense]|uniref:Gamma interferon inducible lysosomal thiol reductase n=1 Tax=Penicillium argentinense TaxID=1131581 RepID=A0A9W9K9Q9_9EURO|nr:uncharacterized protein N7532_005204 [Penicillium argentinense]KAJ5098203.1 hypothetical protein N7532_005204 [Penicillium argentinense]
MIDSTTPGPFERSSGSMEKLPIHTGENLETPPRHGGFKSGQLRNRSPRNCLLRRIVIALGFLAGFYLLTKSIRIPMPCHMRGHSIPDSETEQYSTHSQEHMFADDRRPSTFNSSQPAESAKIPLEAHIMSKCPDAKACIQQLILPTMEQVSDKVDFRLSFIADWNSASEEIKCMHGPTECIGNMLMLCAANLPFPPKADESLLPTSYPRTPIIRSLGFANCLINQYPRIPEREFVHQCALEHGIDFDSLNRCASQQDDNPDDSLSGIALLRSNVKRGKDLGVTTSCTVRLDNKVWCVRDDGKWKNCVKEGEGGKPQLLIDQINKLYKDSN